MTKYYLVEGANTDAYGRAQMAYRIVSLIDTEWISMIIAHQIVDIIKDKQKLALTSVCEYGES